MGVPSIQFFTSYSQTELHLENCCLQRARRALQGMNNPLRGRKGELLFADDAAVAFQIPFCLTIKASLQWHIMRKKQRGVLYVPYVLMSKWTYLCQTRKINVFVKPNEQCRACSDIVMARKRTFRGTRKERLIRSFVHSSTCPLINLLTCSSVQRLIHQSM